MKKKFLSVEEYRKIQINVLDAIAKLCNDNGINYFLGAGTLLGAVRHKGYIPWDDDIDIILLRSEYEKLVKILKEQNEFDWLGIVDHNNDGYFYTFAKAVDKNTIAKQDDNLTEYGIWVDIFPYDNLPNDEKKSNYFLNKGYYYRSLVMSMTTDFSSDKKGFKILIKKILNIYAKALGKERILKKYLKLCKKYEGHDCDYVGSLFSPYRTKERFKREWFEKSILMSFEGKQYSCPIGYDKYLTQLYGDYMTLPPEEKRRQHGITAWYK